MYKELREYTPFVSPHDPCPPIGKKTYVIPPNQVIGFQPPDLPQFSPAEALRYGTLWPAFYSSYDRHGGKVKGGCDENHG